MAETAHLTHRFAPGLRFDGRWTYAARMPSGRSYWARLPATRAGDVAAADPQRAWWCVRQCVAVLNHKPWRSVHLPSGLPAQPECGDVALALGAMLANWNVKVLDEPSTRAPLLRSTDALLAGGCSLLQLQARDSSDGAQPVFWAWVIGVEMQERFPRAKRISAFDTPGRPRALLVWPFGSPPAWNHALRVTVDDEGLCDAQGIDARTSRYRCMATITLEPLSNDIAINDGFYWPEKMQKSNLAPEQYEREIPLEPGSPGQHLICGLHFDGHWQYKRRTEAGKTSWAQLPMASDPVAPADPYGTWWCVRRCTVVLEQRHWLFLQLPRQLPPLPGAEEVAEILDVLLPDWNVQAPAQCAQTPLLCAQAVEQGGSALLMLESPECDGPKPGIFWAWVVGYEPELPLPCADDCVASDTLPSPGSQAMAPPRALLALPFGSTTPWSSGYATRIQVPADGTCHLQGADGPWLPCKWLGTVTLAARPPPA